LGLLESYAIKSEPSHLARGFIPAGLRSGPETWLGGDQMDRVAAFLGLLRSPAGINPLATKAWMFIAFDTV
jgi:hypothetical protein